MFIHKKLAPSMSWEVIEFFICGFLFNYSSIQQLPCQANSESPIFIRHSLLYSSTNSYCFLKASSLLIVVTCPSNQIILSVITV
nr:MAG TPA: hypothetical protein [Caudoviricetes sp.]